MSENYELTAPTNIYKTVDGVKSNYKNIYVNDAKFEEYYDNSVTVKNPVVNAMEDYEVTDHIQEKINWFRTIDIMIVTGTGYTSDFDAHLMKGWGNWRNKSDIAVDSRVMLYMDDLTKIGMTYSQNYGFAWDEVASSGPLGKVADMAKQLQNTAIMMAAATGASINVDASTPMGTYQKVPYIKSIDPFKVEPNSLTFTFNFGQAGLFSGEQEVVRPVLALAKIFVPDSVYSGLSVPSQATVYKNIAANMNGIVSKTLNNIETYTKQFAESAAADFDITDLGGSLAKIGGDAVGTASNIATNFVKDMYKTIDSGLAASMKSVKSIMLRVGRYCLPAVFPSEVSWNFDFSHVDEYGFPCKGSITFSGLQAPRAGYKKGFSFSDDTAGTSANTKNQEAEEKKQMQLML